jgi:hypothetical protein
MIPKINSFTNGNNSAQWKFESEAIGESGQYRTDMLVGFPKDKPETYRVNLLLSSDLRFSPDPEQIIHPIPIKFEK